MTEFDPTTPPTPPTPPAPPVSPQQPSIHHPEREQRSAAPWVAGLVLILLGGFFLLQNFGLLRLNNWWALFILIPAIGSFATAWSIYQRSGWRLTSAVRGPLIGGLILSMVTAAFLFELDWGLIWPVFLILIGIGALVTAFARN